MKKYLLLAIIFCGFHHLLVAQISFTKQDGPHGGSVSEVVFNSSSHLFIRVSSPGGLSSVYRSTNNGQDWTKLSIGTNGLDDFEALDIFVDGGDKIYVLGKTKIYKSSALSNGDTWVSVTPPAPFAGGDEIVKTDDGELYIRDAFFGVLRSLDDGGTWTNISNNLPPPNYLSIVASGNDVYLGVLNAGVQKLPNNSVVWSSFNTGLSATTTVGSLALRGSTLYESDRQGVHYYNGATWVLIAGSGAGGSKELTENFNNSDHIVVPGSGTIVYVAFQGKFNGVGKLYKSANATDGPWTELTSVGLNDGILSVNAFQAGSSVFVGYKNLGLQRSIDDGIGWGFSDNGLNFSHNTSFVRANTTGDFFVANGSRYVHYSNSSGFGWNRVLLNGCTSCAFSTLIKLGNGNLLAIGNETYRSTNNGSSWSDIGGPAVFLDKAVTGTGAKFYGHNLNGSTHSYYVSTSATPAATWSSLAVTGLPGSYNLQGLEADGSSNLYFLTNNGPVQLFKVLNTQTTATEITNSGMSQISALHSFNGAIYLSGFRSASGKYEIAKTSDGGGTWTYISTDAPTKNLSLDDFNFQSTDIILGLDAGGAASEFYYTNDAGVTWVKVNSYNEGYNTKFAGGAIDANGFLNVCFDGATSYRSDDAIFRPNAVTSLKSIGASETEIVIEWDHDGLYAHEFEISRRIQGEVNYVVLDNASSQQRYYVDEDIIESTNYQYKVVAKSPAGNSNITTLNVTSGNDCALTIPDNRSWTGTVPAAFSNPTIGIRKLNDDSFLITDFTAGSLVGIGSFGSSISTHFFENCGQPFIDPKNDIYPNGPGSWTPGTSTITLNFQVDKELFTPTTKTITLVLNSNDPIPEKPTNVTPLILGNSAIEISWSAGFYQKSYSIGRATNIAGPFTQVGLIDYPTTKIIDNGPFTVGTEYFYRIRASNANGTPLTNDSDVVSVIYKLPNFVISNTTVSNFVAASVGSYWADFNGDGEDDYLTLGLDPLAEKASPVIFKNLGNGDFEKIDVTLQDKSYIFCSVIDYNNDGFEDLIFGIDETNGVDFYAGNGDFTFTSVSGAQLGDIASVNINVGNITFADINSDGLLDALLISGEDTEAPKLYKQNANNSFSLIPGGDLANDLDNRNSALWADYNKDGAPDVLIVNSNGPLRLYQNAGDETFTKVLVGNFNATSALSAAWGDYNNDTQIDLFVSEAAGNAIYLNSGTGSFTKNATTSITLPTFAVTSTWGDYNNDGFLDLYVAGFFGQPNKLFLRDPSATTSIVFTKIEQEKITDSSVTHYGVGTSDYNKDGFLDIGMSAFTFSESDEVLPANNYLFKNNNTVGNWAEVKLEPVNGNKSAIGAKVTVTAGGKTFYREVMSSSGIASRNSLRVHFGLGAEAGITSIQVKWPSGITQNLPNPPINQLLIITEDASAPQPTAILPTNNATKVAIDTKIELTFDEPPIAKAGKKIGLFKPGETVPVINLDVTTGTITGNKISFTLPSALDFFILYTVTAEAGAFADIYNNATPVIIWTFTTVDNVGPVITYTPVNVTKGFATTNFAVTITDNSGTVSTAKLSHRKIGSSGEFTDLAGVLNTTSGSWDFAIQESFYDDMGMEFFITATDVSENLTRNPTGTANHYSYFNNKETSAPKFPTSSLVFGGTDKTWNIVSIPFELGTSATVTSVLDELGPFDNTQWRLLTYQNQTSWAEFPTNFSAFTRGKGYFLNIKTPPSAGITIAEEILSPQNNQSSLFTMDLAKGWNQIGNPYLVPINWANIKAFNSTVTGVGDLKIYNSNGRSYDNGTTLEVYKGGFVFTNEAVTGYKFSFTGQISGGRKRSEGRIASTELDSKDWRTMLTLSQADITFKLGGVGMNPNASLSYDDFDDVTVPRFNEYLEMNFHHAEHFAKRFSRDVVPTQDEYTWEFTVDSNLSGVATFTWDNTKFGLNEKELVLFDVEQQKPVDMRKMNSYSFDASSSNKFRIYFGENLMAKIQPERILLGKAYPNPANYLTTIPFSLPQASGSYQVRLEVYDMMGKQVSVLQNGLLPAGFYESQWDTSKDQLVNGMYTYRLVVAGDGKSEVYSNKIVLNK